VAPVSGREGCPAWCTDHYRDEYASGIVVEGHAAVRVADGPFERVPVQILQSSSAQGDGTRRLYINSCCAGELRDAGDMATLMRALGHKKIAAAVEELAALVSHNE